MIQRERLIELLNHIGKIVIQYNTDDFIEQLADYLIENGCIAPPCKVGDTVHRIVCNKVYSDWIIESIVIYQDEIGFYDDSENYFTVYDIGKTVFLTREEAEKALKVRENK